MPAIRPAPRVIEGRFITLEPLTDEMLPELYAAIGDPLVFAGGWGGGPAGHQPSEADFIDFARGYFPWTENVYAARIAGGPDDGTLVGTSSLADCDEKNEHAHIGWTAWSPRVWGTAVNPEAKLLMLTEAFESGFGRLKLQADEVNVRSRAAITKLGAQFEGIQRRDRRRADGSWRSTAIYSILPEEWPAVREGLKSRLADFTGPVRL